MIREAISTTTVADSFPYEYIGGGYYRRKGVPKGQVADMLHGQAVIEAVVGHTVREICFKGILPPYQ